MSTPNGAIKIEKGVPLPSRSTFKYPWHGMEVGDSFFVSLEGHKCKTLLKLQNSVSRSAPREFRVSTRRTADGIRVWRIA